jgi:hypothetical protein
MLSCGHLTTILLLLFYDRSRVIKAKLVSLLLVNYYA